MRIKEQFVRARWPLLAFICFCAFLITVSIFICQYSGWQKELETTTKYLEDCLKQRASQVIIITDKAKYKQGEEVKIKVANEKIKPISHHHLLLFGLVLQKQEASDWKEVFYFSRAEAKTVCLGVMYELPECYELSSGKIHQEVWDQKIFECREEEIKEKIASPGMYRFALYYWENEHCRPSQEREILYSNRFTIEANTEFKEPESN